MHRFAFAVFQSGPRSAMPRWSTLVCAILLAACGGSPRAAVSPSPVAPGNAAQVAACDGASSARAALQRVADELKAHGLQLQASCAAPGPGWVVQVLVVDGVKASKIVRGPLADGQGVDMGTPAGVVQAGAGAAGSGFSPDVQFNRQWLRATMARHQFDNAADAWWRFALRGGGSTPNGDTDLAAR